MASAFACNGCHKPMTCCWECTVCFWYKPMALKILYDASCLTTVLLHPWCMHACVRCVTSYIHASGVSIPRPVMSINVMMTSSPRSYKLRILTDGGTGFRLPPSILGGGDVRQIFEVCFGELEKNELQGGTVVGMLGWPKAFSSILPGSEFINTKLS